MSRDFEQDIRHRKVLSLKSIEEEDEMLHNNSRFFTEGFKAETMKLIRTLRPAFCEDVFRQPEGEVKRHPFDYSTVEMHPGYRFFSDEQCWHSFVATATKGKQWIWLTDAGARREALAVEEAYLGDRQLWREGAWLALRHAAECDHFYQFEKTY